MNRFLFKIFEFKWVFVKYKILKLCIKYIRELILFLMFWILRCNILRDFLIEGFGFVLMLLDSRRIKNMNSCVKKLILRD